jgi:septal ring factor EnvC (AmiA/AmiB activator)
VDILCDDTGLPVKKDPANPESENFMEKFGEATTVDRAGVTLTELLDQIHTGALSQMDALQTQLTMAQADLTTSQAALTASQAQATGLEEQVASATAQIQGLQSQLAAAQAEVTKLTAQASTVAPTE